MQPRGDVRCLGSVGQRRAFSRRPGRRRVAGPPLHATAAPFAGGDFSTVESAAGPLDDAGAAGLDPHGQKPSARRALYLKLLNWCFAGFNSTRIVTYVPTMWAIHMSGDSSQHSMLTWLAWVGANSSMAAWLYEHNGQRFDKAVAVNVGNALMCLLTCALIAWYRW